MKSQGWAEGLKAARCCQPHDQVTTKPLLTPLSPPQYLYLFQSIFKVVNNSKAVAFRVLHHVHSAVSWRTPNCCTLEFSWSAPSFGPQPCWWCSKICFSLENLDWKPLPCNRQVLQQSWRYSCGMRLTNAKGQTRLACVTMICLRSETGTTPHGYTAVAVFLHTQDSDNTKVTLKKSIWRQSRNHNMQK